MTGRVLIIVEQEEQIGLPVMPSCKMVLRWQYRCWTRVLVCAVGLLLVYTCQGATTIKGRVSENCVVLLYIHTQSSYNLHTVMLWPGMQLLKHAHMRTLPSQAIELDSYKDIVTFERDTERESHCIFCSHLRADHVSGGPFLGTQQ